MTLERWKQSFRLGKKLSLKFDREEAAEDGDEQPSEGAGKKAASKEGRITLIVELDFSDHEKLSHTRWLDRLPSEAPFKDASPQLVRAGEETFAKTAELFESLD